MKPTGCFREREAARTAAQGARRIAEAAREDLGLIEAGGMNNVVTALTEAVCALAEAIDKLADASERQEASE